MTLTIIVVHECAKGSTTVKRFIFASENICERPVFCREKLFAFFIFAAIF